MIMKNIHILPTPNPSCLVLETVNNNLFLTTTKSFPTNIMKFQNIYITSDEEIKDGYYLNTEYGNVIKCNQHTESVFAVILDKSHLKKIILTTDPILIKYGIQAIDDDFLEWFVKNPSCKEVRVERTFIDTVTREPIRNWSDYKIIIPKEEPKQETLEEANETELYQTINKIIDGGRDLPKGFNVSRGQAIDYAFEIALKVAKWQQDSNYSEEEVHEIILSYQNNVENSPNHITYNEWFEQFKKK